ncbi:MAG: SpoIID/LytB domain-containing protein [Phycisphaerae bacterium]|nr:SpoIID/LytB domain-containing protein [Phycisphaerae bacterium]
MLAFLCGCKDKTDRAVPVEPNIASDEIIRVLLLDDANKCTVILKGAAQISDTNSPLAILPFEPDNSLLITADPNNTYINGNPFTAKKINLHIILPGTFTLENEYRGDLLIIRSDNGSFDLINSITLESYLAGVVGAEMPPYWESAALDTQSIVARTYCLYIKKRFGTNRHWDVRATQSHQVYRGILAESVPVWQSIRRTLGTVLVCENGKDRYDIFPAYYSSICGGHTEDSKNVFGDSFAPLNGVECPYCFKSAKPKFYFWPVAYYSLAEVTKKLMARYPQLEPLEQICDITVTQKTDYGNFARLTMIKLHGTDDKTDFIRGEDFRLCLDPSGTILKSAICEISVDGDKLIFTSGRGFGHGVGLCQCGAEAMARNGKTAQEILNYYFPHSKTINIHEQ